MMDKFISTVLKNIGRGTTVLDIGCGDGSISNAFYKRGAIITAIDKRPRPELLNKTVSFRNILLEEYINGVYLNGEPHPKFDIIFMRNVIQFIDKTIVVKNILPKLVKMVAPGGMLAIETFYADPEPAFDHPLKATYNLAELIESVKSDFSNAVLDIQEPILDMDLIGVKRMFYITDLIVKK